MRPAIALPPAKKPSAPLSVNVASNFVAMAVRLVTGFVVAPLLIRGIGTERYGAWTLLAQVLAYFSLFDFGIRGAVGYWITRYVAAGEEENARDVVATAFWILIPVSCVLAAAGVAFAQFAPDILELGNVPPAEVVSTMSILAVVIAFALPAGCLDAVLTSHQRFDLANAVEIAYLLVSSGALLAVVFSGGGLVQASVSQAFAYGSRWVILRYLAGRVDPGFSLSPGRFNRAQVPHLSRLGGRKLVIDLAQLVISRTDLVVAGAFLDLRAVALFSVGRQIVYQITAANGAVARVFTPRMTSFHAGGKPAELMSSYISCSNLNACISLTGAAGVLLFSTPFLRLWVGDEFVTGGLIMRSDVVTVVMMIAALPAMLQAGLRQTVFASGEWSLLMWLGVSEAIGNLALSLLLVRPLGLLGIALGTCIPALITTGLILPWQSSKRDGISIGRWWHEAAKRPLFSVIAAGAVMAAIQSRWPVATWPELIAQGTLLVVMTSAAAWFWALSSSNRDQAKARLRIIARR